MSCVAATERHLLEVPGPQLTLHIRKMSSSAGPAMIRTQVTNLTVVHSLSFDYLSLAQWPRNPPPFMEFKD